MIHRAAERGVAASVVARDHEALMTERLHQQDTALTFARLDACE
ncbi:hypothetical protein SS05631_a44160 (plasmid) [Sinorhizobium sp. CCBAU 05631]|nr:hypothetical protein SS05631_a44160 [Sinorhizobium sp. CCBAU 05631]